MAKIEQTELIGVVFVYYSAFKIIKLLGSLFECISFLCFYFT